MKVMKEKLKRYKNWGNPGSYHYLDKNYMTQGQGLWIDSNYIILSNWKDSRRRGIQIIIDL